MKYEWEKHESGECDDIKDVPLFAKIVAVDDVAVIDYCEGCGGLIMEGEKYASDGEGTVLCEKCTKEFAKSEDYYNQA
jgi:formylmethanofuran dehydrogenase subunit E